MRMRGLKIGLMVVLALGLIAQACPDACHHDSNTPHALSCAVAVPQLYQLVILMNVVLLAISSGSVLPQAPTFALLKPPRFVPLGLTAR